MHGLFSRTQSCGALDFWNVSAYLTPRRYRKHRVVYDGSRPSVLPAGLQGLSVKGGNSGDGEDAAAESASEPNGALHLECRVCPATGDGNAG